MSAKKYTYLDTTTIRHTERSATQVSTGASNAGDIIALDETGHIDTSLLPSTGGASSDAIVATEAIAAGDWVNVYNNVGTRACRKAIAADATKPAAGFVTAAFSAGATASVYKVGDNTKVALTGFTVADIGARVFLSPTVGGGTIKTCPAAGNLLQPLGTVTDVSGTFVTVAMGLGDQVQL
jgi:hypothetical protein